MCRELGEPGDVPPLLGEGVVTSAQGPHVVPRRTSRLTRLDPVGGRQGQTGPNGPGAPRTSVYPLARPPLLPRQRASHNGRMPYDLERFVEAQDAVYDDVLDELRHGRKTSHWMWFVFPQLAGLGRSDVSRYYAIRSLDEARAYLAHPVLGPRLRECARLVLAARAPTPEVIFGGIDALKLRSSMTLFERAAPEEPLFGAVLERYYGGRADEQTDELLAALDGVPPAGPGDRS